MSTLQIHCLKVKYRYPFHAAYNCVKTAPFPFRNLKFPHINLAVHTMTLLRHYMLLIYMYDILFRQG